MADIDASGDAAPETVRTGPQRVCESCGKRIQGRSTKRFCDNRCKAEFHRRKKVDKAVGIIRGLKEGITELENELAGGSGA